MCVCVHVCVHVCVCVCVCTRAHVCVCTCVHSLNGLTNNSLSFEKYVCILHVTHTHTSQGPPVSAMRGCMERLQKRGELEVHM